MGNEAADIASQVMDSGKYGFIARDTVLRLCQEYMPRYKSKKDVIKAVKKQLHIIHGAFFPDRCHEQAMMLIESSNISDQELSVQLMQLHPSTRERMPVLRAFYDFLAPCLKDAKTVLDIGCGFHPCTLPFMGLPDKVTYIAGDINYDTVKVVRAFFDRLHVAHDVQILDAAGKLPDVHADIAFLFKLIPVLEQQKKGLAYHLMDMLTAKTIIVTFPVKSLSGREKDMEQFYSSQFEKNLPAAFSIAQKAVVGMELVYIVSKTQEQQQQALSGYTGHDVLEQK